MHSILIIDDEKSMCEFLSIMLKRDGYRVRYATNPQAGLTLAQNDIFDLAIIDILYNWKKHIAKSSHVKHNNDPNYKYVIPSQLSYSAICDAKI